LINGSQIHKREAKKMHLQYMQPILATNNSNSMHVPTPAPKVEAATAEAVKPKAAPLAEEPVASSVTNAEAVSASFVCAEPPPNASLTTDADKDDDNTNMKKYDDITKPTVEALRATGKIVFEGYAGVIIGAVHKSLCEKSFQCFYDERCFLSYGEVKRYIVIMKDSHVIFVYGDDDMSLLPMYTIPIDELDCLHEDPNNPSFYSHTISPEANPGLLGEPFSNNKTKGSLDTILLLDGKGKIAFQLAFDRSEEGESVLDTFMKAVVQASSPSKRKEVK
jgi:hypothetical protein